MKQILPCLCLAFVFFFLPGCKSKVSTDTSGKDNTSTVTENGTTSNGETSSSGQDRFKETEIRVMWVAPFTKRCVGEMEQDCMLISFNKDRPAQGEWELFYDGIRGFNYEKGNLYQLKVKVGTLKEEFIMMDVGSKEYFLLEVLRKDGA